MYLKTTSQCKAFFFLTIIQKSFQIFALISVTTLSASFDISCKTPWYLRVALYMMNVCLCTC